MSRKHPKYIDSCLQQDDTNKGNRAKTKCHQGEQRSISC